MTHERASASRLDLLQRRAYLLRVRRGVELLRRKREALVAELFSAARPAIDARRALADGAAAAHRALLAGLTGSGADGLRALAAPARRLAADVSVGRVWGVPVARVEPAGSAVRTVDERGAMPGAWGPAALEVPRAYERLLDQLVEAAPRELLVRALGHALSRTTRQLATLERRIAPSVAAEVRQVARTLDEREREEQTRLRHLRRPR